MPRDWPTPYRPFAGASVGAGRTPKATSAIIRQSAENRVARANGPIGGIGQRAQNGEISDTSSLHLHPRGE
jgi:hypothetical protein